MVNSSAAGVNREGNMMVMGINGVVQQDAGSFMLIM